MILLLCGEGPTDMGRMALSAKGELLEPGPMGWLVCRLAEEMLGYSPAECGCVRLVKRTDLNKRQKRNKKANLGRMTLRGKNKPQGALNFYDNARTLTILAKEIEQREKTEVVAVLFKDTDDAKGSARPTWEEKFNSIVNGFKGCARCVPMVPKPKVEAWLLCCADAGRHDCSGLENKSTSAMKGELKKALGKSDTNRESLLERMQTCWDNPASRARLERMPSFQVFHDRFIEAVSPLPPAP